MIYHTVHEAVVPPPLLQVQGLTPHRNCYVDISVQGSTTLEPPTSTLHPFWEAKVNRKLSTFNEDGIQPYWWGAKVNRIEAAGHLQYG